LQLSADFLHSATLNHMAITSLVLRRLSRQPPGAATGAATGAVTGCLNLAEI
jgi:hypothetical protein